MGQTFSEAVNESETENMTSLESLSPLRFHQVCGQSIELKKNNAVAFRCHSFNYGLTFTDRPVLVSEPIFVKIKETSTNWSGAIRIGFTANDPSSMIKSKLPAHSCPDFVASHGNWAKALPESLNKKNSIISFYVESCGNMYYKFDKEAERYLLNGVDTSRKLWGVIDVYGNTMSVELVPDPERVLVSNPELTLSKPYCNLDLAFHELHGKTAVLSCDNTVARRRGIYYSYVFSSIPLNFDEKVVIKVNKLDPIINGPFEYGITTCDPSTIIAESLPKNTDDLLDWSDYWVVKQDSCQYQTQDLLLFCLKPDGQLLVTKNGNSLSTMLHVDTSQPLWLFFKMCGTIDEICMLGSSTGENIDIVREFQNLNLLSDDDFRDIKKKSIEDTSNERITKDKKKAKKKSAGARKDECVICFDKPCDCTLYKCGHMCMCYDCAVIYWKPKSNVQCPICRQVIIDIIKVYT